MNSAYGPLAGSYDRLTRDVDYSCFAEYYEKAFAEAGGEFKLLLDLCCGTGSLTAEMAERGYEMIAVDSSVDMLMEAQSKTTSVVPSPLFICQPAEELDLYGTVDAAYSSLDSINYISPDRINEVFKRLSLFVRPGGLFIFDIRDADWMRSMDGYVSVDEDTDIFCVWRADFSSDKLTYGMDIFTKERGLWRRDQEEHTEYAYSVTFLEKLLSENSFTLIRSESDVQSIGEGRIFLTAVRKL